MSGLEPESFEIIGNCRWGRGHCNLQFDISPHQMLAI